MAYKPKRMPSRYYEGAPNIVRKDIAFITRTLKSCGPLPFDIILTEDDGHGNAVGVDVGEGIRGEHFFLTPQELRTYRQNRSKLKTNWNELPEGVKATITSYLESE